MSFVKCARHKKEQNMVVFQYHGCIYYRTTREIRTGSELLVWYDTKYTQLLGLPLAWNENKGRASIDAITASNRTRLTTEDPMHLSRCLILLRTHVCIIQREARTDFVTIAKLTHLFQSDYL